MDSVDLNFRMNATGNAVPELRKAQGAVQRLGTQIDKSNARMRGFNNGITTMQANTRKFAMGGLQQAGYQLGDYAVQVANGTSKMQAFGQQAPQFLQIFGPIGAIVGAGVAIISAFAVAQERSAGASKSLTDSLIPLDQALKNVKQSTSEARGEIALLVSGFKTAEEASIANAISLQKQVVAKRELNLENARGIAQVGAETNLRLAQEQLQSLNGQLDALQKGNMERAHTIEAIKDIAGSTEGLLQSEQALNNIFEARIGKIDDTANLYSDVLGTEAGLGAAVAANNALYAARLGTIDATASTYVDILGSEAGLGAAIAANNALYAARIGTIDDTANNYVDVLGSEEGLQAAQAASLEIYRKSLEAGDKLKSNVQSVARAVKTELSPEMQRLKGIQDSVASSFENAMMSAVDGTNSVKGAFRSMAAEIIKELYRVFVVKQITGFISSAIGGYFNTNQVSGASMPLGTGNVRPQMRPSGARAMGGQVTGGRAYMVGERGPEMVIPSRNAHVVPNNQLGAGGGVTVIQNNTFGSGVSRAEVNAMLPKMIEATKAAVVDAKRQGGSYGRAFA